MTKFAKQGVVLGSDYGYEYAFTVSIDGKEYAVPAQWAKSEDELLANEMEVGKIPNGQVMISCRIDDQARYMVLQEVKDRKVNTYKKLTFEEFAEKGEKLYSHFKDTLGIHNNKDAKKLNYEMYCAYYDSYDAGDDGGWFIKAAGVGGMYAYLYETENSIIEATFEACADGLKGRFGSDGLYE